MTFTTGDDVVAIRNPGTDIDGLGGTDTLILEYTGRYDGKAVGLLELNWSGGDLSSRMVLWVTRRPSVFEDVRFRIDGIEAVDFTAREDIGLRLWAGDGDDTLRGGLGGDEFYAGGGANLITTGDGWDGVVLTPGDGRDTVSLGTGNDGVSGVTQRDLIDGGDGTDRLGARLGQAWSGTLSDLQANPNWTSIERFDFRLSGQDDVLRVDVEVTGVLRGGAGDDLLILDRRDTGAITMLARGTPFQSWERMMFLGSDDRDEVLGSGGNDTILGGGGNDRVRLGRGGDDSVRAGAGNDIILDVSAGDTVDGGAGQDAVQVNMSEATAGVVLGRGRSVDNITHVERFNGILTPFDDKYFARQPGSGLDGGAGYDVLHLDYSRLRPGLALDFWDDGTQLRLSIVNDRFGPPVFMAGWEEYEITGSDANDGLSTRDGDDTLRGGLGNDTLSGGGGDNVLFGGVGDDALGASGEGVTQAYGGAGDDSFSDTGGDDLLFGGAGLDRVTADFSDRSDGVRIDASGPSGQWSGIETFNVTLTGGNDLADLGAVRASGFDGGAGRDRVTLDYSGADDVLALQFSGTALFLFLDGEEELLRFDFFEEVRLVATEGNDRVENSTADDTVIGLGGNDTLEGYFGKDLLLGGDGDDLLDGGEGEDVLYGGVGDDTHLGGLGDDRLAAGDGADVLAGGEGDDALYGAEGNDILLGELGNDTLSGGAGRDLFVFAGSAPSGQDRIVDFESVADALYISGALREADIDVTTVGADLRVSWDQGSVLVVGAASGDLVVLFDGDL